MNDTRLVNLSTVTELKEDEFLLKIYFCFRRNLGFMTKLNKDGSIPAAFKSWKPNYREPVKDSYIIKEYPREGWKVTSYRTGPQDWVKVRHPLDFVVEIYMKDFFNILLNHEIINGEIKGKFRWEAKKLIEG